MQANSGIGATLVKTYICIAIPCGCEHAQLEYEYMVN